MKFFALRAHGPRGFLALRAPRTRRTSRGIVLGAAASLLLSACGGLSEAMTAHTDVVARAAGKELKVEEAAQMLSANPQIPGEAQVVQELADIWVDYMLLATAVAEDSSLSELNLDTFTAPAREGAMMTKLRDQVIHPDTIFTDAEITQAWATQGPGVELHARHILLKVPTEATAPQRDSVRRLAESLRQRAVGGEDFSALARQYSQDPGSAQNGGDLGFFSRGRMVAPFEDAAFKLKPGEISPVVETPFGYHVIQAVDRRQPEIGPQREEFKRFLVQKAEQDAETSYLDSLSRAANVQVAAGGLALVREIAGHPETSLRGRAADREIATYKGGAFTAGEFLDFIRSQGAQGQTAFSGANDEQLTGYIQQLTRKELLLQQAKARGMGLSKTQEDSIRTEARAALHQLVQATGLSALAGQKSNSPAIEDKVNAMVRGLVTGQVNLVPLGRLGFALRELLPNEINEGTFTQVAERLGKLRAAQPAPSGPQGGMPAPGQAPGQAPAQAPAPAPDTAR
jgi:hypothetical protein